MSEQAKAQTDSLIQEFLRYVDMMEELLRHNRTVDSRLETPFCTLEPPLGRARLKLIQLIATLLSTGNHNWQSWASGGKNLVTQRFVIDTWSTRWAKCLQSRPWRLQHYEDLFETFHQVSIQQHAPSQRAVNGDTYIRKGIAGWYRKAFVDRV